MQNHEDIRPTFRSGTVSQCPLSCRRPGERIVIGNHFCNSLDWDAPLQQKVCEMKSVLCANSTMEIDDAMQVNAYLGQAGSFKLIVHYQYHETNKQLRCERVNKRINLEFFIQQAVLKGKHNVEFHFSSSGVLPHPVEYFNSMGLQPSRSHIFPQLPNVFHERVGVSSTDLCQHGRFLEKHNEYHAGPGRFALLLNDGVRGPVVSPEYEEAVNSFPGLVEKGVPPWFVPFIYKYAINRDVMLVSTMMSAELEAHLQSYTLAIHSRAVRTMSKMLTETCNPSVSKQLAIWAGELGASNGILRKGFSIASLYPRINNFTKLHAQCATAFDSPQDLIRRNRKPQLETCYPSAQSYLALAEGHCMDRVAIGYHLLNQRRNPAILFPGPWEDIVFVKYGGELYRQELVHEVLQGQVKNVTMEMLELQSLPRPCPRMGRKQPKRVIQEPDAVGLERVASDSLNSTAEAVAAEASNSTGDQWAVEESNSR